MKKRAMAVAGMMVLLASAAVGAANRPVGLFVKEPTMIRHERSRLELLNSFDSNGVQKKRSFRYAGEISYGVGKGAQATISLEAFFVTRADSKGAKDRLAGRQSLGEFQFGDGNRRLQAFEFESPRFTEELFTRSKTRTHYQGVIIRAIEDGKVRKVISMPYNGAWIKAAQSSAIAMDWDWLRHEQEVHEPLPGTGDSTPPGWMDDFKEAQEIAKREGKWLFVVLSRSQTGAICDCNTADAVMRQAVWNTVKFQAAAKEKYVLVYVDDPADRSLLSPESESQSSAIQRDLLDDAVLKKLHYPLRRASLDRRDLPCTYIVSADGEVLAFLGRCARMDTRAQVYLHVEKGVDGYIEYFRSVDSGLRTILSLRSALQGLDANSPEALRLRHEALMTVEPAILADLFPQEVRSLIAADRSYGKFYPYFKYVEPLVEERVQLTQRLGQAVKQFLNEKHINLNNPNDVDENRKYFAEVHAQQPRVFKERGYAAQFRQLLEKVKATEQTVDDDLVRARLAELRRNLVEQIDSQGENVDNLINLL
ncbi:MAG: thioredoxin family protein [Kiritimatiellae bacterium]|nr:thioredoxin family protein [Kiritimatiellia bacterium]